MEFRNTFRLFAEITSANNDSGLIKIESFENKINRENFYLTYEYSVMNFVSGLAATIKISNTTYRRARMLPMDYTDSDTDQQLKLQEMFDQAGVYLDLYVVDNKRTYTLNTTKLINLSDYWSYPLGSNLLDADNVIPFSEFDTLYCRIRNAGYGMLGENDFIRITGSCEQHIYANYANVVIQPLEISANIP
jgi:hypothetical protein